MKQTYCIHVCLKSDSHLPKKFVLFADWNFFKNDKKCFLFHLESSSLFQGIWVFVMTFWPCRKNGLIRKIRLTSEVMTSQPSLQQLQYTLLNISRRKGNQTLKFVQLIEYNKRNTFLQNLYRKLGKETSTRSLFIFLKSLIWDENKWSAA